MWPSLVPSAAVTYNRSWPNRRPLVAAAEVFAVDVSRITSAVSYYGDYGDEIDAEIELAEEASMRAERARSVQQKLIA